MQMRIRGDQSRLPGGVFFAVRSSASANVATTCRGKFSIQRQHDEGISDSKRNAQFSGNRNYLILLERPSHSKQQRDTG
jgi:hypothetical protein